MFLSRLSAIARTPQLALGSVAVIAASAAVAVGTGASFTSDTANPANAFEAGNLTHGNSKDGQSILTASKMVPGSSTTGTVVITNTGDVPGTFSLSKSNLTDTPGPNGGQLSGKLDLVVQDVTVPASPVAVYSGKLSAMPTQALGTFTAGQAKTFRFTATFPDGGVPASATTGDNAFKLSKTSVQFDWRSVSA